MNSRRLRALAVAFLLTLTWATVEDLAAREELDYPYSKDQLGYTPHGYSSCSDDNAWMNRYAAYLEVVHARGQLSYYDEVLKLYESDPEEYWAMATNVNEMRGDILSHAISAYYWIGPMEYPESNQEVLEALLAEKEHPLWYEYPTSLQELVDIGIISHLPASPYPNETWVNHFPAVPIQPGAVYYRALPALGERGVMHVEPGKLENYALFIFDEIQLGEDPEIIRLLFPGDGYQLEQAMGEALPRGILYADGIYRNHDTKAQSVVYDELEE